MNELVNTYVIVNKLGGTESYFENYLSSNKEDLEEKCVELNKDFNSTLKEFYKKNNVDYIETVKYEVLDLKKAITNFEDICSYYYSEHDASL
jgi:hypothetical protein